MHGHTFPSTSTRNTRVVFVFNTEGADVESIRPNSNKEVMSFYLSKPIGSTIGLSIDESWIISPYVVKHSVSESNKILNTDKL
jgi:hypothetical protein